MPFTYLGLSLGTTKPTVQEFSPLLTRIERRLSRISTFLSYDGRLIMVNSVLSALPTFYKKHCLWSKGISLERAHV
jgi:hypothetical protein